MEYNFRQDRGTREPVIISSFYPPIIDETLFNTVQEKLKSAASYWQNAHAHRSEYLLSRLVVCDACGHHFVGTAAKRRALPLLYMPELSQEGQSSLQFAALK